MHVARRILAIRAIESFPFLRREAPEHHVQRLHLVCTEAPVSIARIDPQLPIFLRPAAALVGDVVDAREERGGAAAGVTESYSMGAVFGRVHHIENRAALRPGKTGDGLDHAIAIVDDEANGCGLRVRPIAGRREGEQHRCQHNSHRASGEAIAPTQCHDRILSLNAFSFIDANRCRALDALPSPLWGGDGGWGWRDSYRWRHHHLTASPP